MKNTKKLVSLVLSLMLLAIAIPATAHAASNGWTWRQEVAHQIADLARSLGVPEDHPIIAVAQDVWWRESGTSDSGSYYYSARTGKYYYSNGSSINGNNNGNSNTNNAVSTGVTYTYNGYTWYQYAYDTAQHFRLDNSGRQVWATTTENSRIKNSTRTSTSRYVYYNGSTYYESNTYNNGYNNYNYYNGVITNVSGVDANDALTLAKLIYSYSHADPSQTHQAALGWNVINLAGNRSIASITGSYGDYNPNAPTTDDYGRDLLALAKDLLFRRAAEQNGVVNVGRVLPKDYTWLWIENGVVYHRNAQYGANYQFTNSGTYRSPYST